MDCCLCLTSYYGVMEADWPTVGCKYDEITGAFFFYNPADKLVYLSAIKTHPVFLFFQ